MEIQFDKAASLKEKPQDESKLGFGQIFTDYMFEMRYTEGQGWHDPRICAFEEFEMSPASNVLHYSQEVFEGLKAYRTPDGGISLFRAPDNFARMNRSAHRMAMPPIDEEFVHEALRQLVRTERDWVPHSDGTSLYIRPNYIGIGDYLGVSAAEEYIFYIICSPSGAYYAHGLAPVRILIETDYARAAKGGTGFAKTGGNYAASLIAGVEAHEKGCDQVLWLDAAERKYIQEVGSMNIMFVIDGKVVTPPLDGTILAGITRDSVLQIARSKGIPVEERYITVDEVIDGARSGALTEAFGTGTAAVVSPIGEFSYKDEIIPISSGDGLALDFYETLTGIQYGRQDDPFGWTEKIS
ncbi:MAG: branched-chain amino acid aminotransferase [Clostridia bacterium]|nr:branched-chain amino acid aminotransferase [Clostridia bacterium]